MAPNDEVFSDEDSDSDDEEEEAGSIHHFKKIGMSMRQSLAAGALHIHVATEQDGHIISSIGGRLGGQLADPAVLQAIQQQDDAAAGEKTPLVTAAPTKETLSAPPLSIWIFPALLCAAAYAFYNIFIKKGSADIHPILGGVVVRECCVSLARLSLWRLLASSEGLGVTVHWSVHWSVLERCRICRDASASATLRMLTHCPQQRVCLLLFLLVLTLVHMPLPPIDSFNS
jgi:hypothetical protein